MPSFLRSKCDHCGFVSEPFRESYLTLSLDEPTELQASNPHPEYPCEIILPRPGERAVLNTHGYNYRSATTEGRLLKYTRFFCRDCGNRYEYRKHLINGIRYIGCLWPIVGSGTIGLIVWLIFSKWPIGLLAFFLTLLISSYLLGAYMEVTLTKKLESKIAETKGKPRCPQCASIETTRQRIKCAKCGHRSAKLIVKGKF